MRVDKVGFFTPVVFSGDIKKSRGQVLLEKVDNYLSKGDRCALVVGCTDNRHLKVMIEKRKRMSKPSYLYTLGIAPFTALLLKIILRSYYKVSITKGEHLPKTARKRLQDLNTIYAKAKKENAETEKSFLLNYGKHIKDDAALSAWYFNAKSGDFALLDKGSGNYIVVVKDGPNFSLRIDNNRLAIYQLPPSADIFAADSGKSITDKPQYYANFEDFLNSGAVVTGSALSPKKDLDKKVEEERGAEEVFKRRPKASLWQKRRRIDK